MTGTFLAWLFRQVPRLSGGQPVVERFPTGGASTALTCVPKLCPGGPRTLSRHATVRIWAAEPVPSQRPDGCSGERGSGACGRALMLRSVRLVRVAMLGELA